MKRASKGLTWLVAVIFVLSIALTGCGNGGSNNASGSNGGSGSGSSSQGSGSGSSSSTTSNKKATPVTLKFVYETTPQKDLQTVNDAINKYLLSKYNMKIQMQQIDWGQWSDKVNLMIASREPMDVIFTAQWDGLSTNVAKGAYLKLNDPNLSVNGKKVGNLIAQYGKGITSSLDPMFLQGSKINGWNYAIPTDKELAAQQGFVYRSDIAKKLGITQQVQSIKTMDDLEPILKTVKQKMPSMTPLWLGDGGSLTANMDFDWMGDSNIPGVVIKSKKSTKVFDQFDYAPYKHVLDVTRKLYKEGLIDSDAATSTVSGDEALKGGNVFMVPESLKPGKANEVALAQNLVGKLGQVSTSDRTTSTSETAGAMLAISSTSKHPVEAMKFINLLHTDKKLLNMIDFGIEGVHYTKVSDNIIKATAKTKDYAPGVAWEIGNQFLNYVWNTEDPQKWEKFKEFNKGSIPSPALGFTFDASSVKTQVGAISNVEKQYQRSLETGSVDPAKILPQFIQKLKSAGLDAVIAAKQKQLNAFLASKKK